MDVGLGADTHVGVERTSVDGCDMRFRRNTTRITRDTTPASLQHGARIPLRMPTLLLALSIGGCASIGSGLQQYAVCSYDDTFTAAAQAVKDRSIVKEDKEAGQIQTAWLEIPMPGRKFGALRRDLPDSRDRSRVLIAVKRMNDVTQVTFTEEREAWGFRGGSRLFGWMPSDPSPDVQREFQSRLDAKLKERGCHTS